MFSPELDLVRRLQSKTQGLRITLPPSFGVTTIWMGIREIHGCANLIQILISSEMKCGGFKPVCDEHEGRGVDGPAILASY